MNEKIAVITGGTSGIGLATAKNLISKNFKVIIIGKNYPKAQNVLNKINSTKLSFIQCDLSERNKIKNLIDELKNIGKIDVLINNAGTLFLERSENSLGIEKTFALNHLSYFQLTLGLMNILENSDDARIINIASNAHKRYPIDINDLENNKSYNGWKTYCKSKLLNILFTYALSKKIKKNIKCNCLHPGFVNSNFGSNNSIFYRFPVKIIKNLFAISNEQGATTPTYLATSKEAINFNGKYFIKCKETKSAKETYDETLAYEIWRKSLNYIK